jgi:nicotinate-nucleotide adenylyltransferase
MNPPGASPELTNPPPTRLGLFGGSFDPVHLGHLLVAQAAQEDLGLERVLFIPAARSPFKPASSPAPAPRRLQLLRLALAGRPTWHVDDQEVRREGVSFSIETARAVAAQYPHAELFWLIGADHVPSLPQWREAEALARLVRFVVISRPGQPPATLPAPFRLRALRGIPLGVSSSEIRARVRAGQPIDLLVPGPVAEAIRNNRLYL